MNQKRFHQLHHKDSDYKPRESYMKPEEINSEKQMYDGRNPAQLESKSDQKFDSEKLEFEDNFLLGYAPFDMD